MKFRNPLLLGSPQNGDHKYVLLGGQQHGATPQKQRLVSRKILLLFIVVAALAAVICVMVSE